MATITDQTSAKYFIRVPATSANLAVGFDTLGISLGIYLELELLLIRSHSSHSSHRPKVVFHCTEPSLPTDESHFVYKVAKQYAQDRKLCEDWDKRLVQLECKMDCNIPLSRGMGSSAAALIAGVLVAFAVTNTPFPEQNKAGSFLDTFWTEILEWTLTYESHADNTSAALIGGFTNVCPLNKGLSVFQHDIDFSNYGALLIIPSRGLSTTESRKVLSPHLLFNIVTQGLQRICMIPVTLAKCPSDLQIWKQVFSDPGIHQPQRLLLVPELKEALNTWQASNEAWMKAVWLSGAGPSVLILVDMNELKLSWEPNEFEKQVPTSLQSQCASWSDDCSVRLVRIGVKGASLQHLNK